MSGRVITKKDSLALKARYEDGRRAGLVPAEKPEVSPEDRLHSTATEIATDVKGMTAAVEKLTSELANKPTPDDGDQKALLVAVNTMSGQLQAVANLLTEHSKQLVVLTANMAAKDDVEYDFIPVRDGRGLVTKWKAAPKHGSRH